MNDLLLAEQLDVYISLDLSYFTIFVQLCQICKCLPNNQSKVTLTTALSLDTVPNDILAFLRQFVL